MSGNHVRAESELGLSDCGESVSHAAPPVRAASKPGRSRNQRTAQRSALMRTIESDIIPRLMLMHRAARPAALVETAQSAQISLQEVHVLVEALLADDGGRAWKLVAGARTRGVRSEALFLDLFTPAARRLGELWEADRCDFASVTTGLWRLQLLLRELSASDQASVETGFPSGRILLAAAPGEQHVFGLMMVAEFFRRAGWDVVERPGADTAELIQVVAKHHFDLAGVSLSHERLLPELAQFVQQLRSESRNSGIGILVGGVVFDRVPQRVVQVGADDSAADAQGAVQAAQRLVSRYVRPS
jgi:MerR family transcriptional regulator, light-induced transcriptional regulator